LQFYGFERANDFISSLGQNIDTLLRRDNKLTQEVEDLRKKIVFLENLIEKMIDSKISFLEKDIAKMSKEKDKDDFYV
jgi:predicted  nucleic acid-binding Zn-ribbon protein